MSNKVENMRTLLLMLFAAISLSVSAQTITVKGNERYQWRACYWRFRC